MKTVSFKCDDSSGQLFVQILNKLSVAGEKRLTRKIRIGGDEYSFVGGCDSVSDLSIDGSLYRNFSDAEKQDLENLRSATHSVPAPVINLAAMVTPSTPPVITPVSIDDNDDDILDSTEAIAVRDVVIDKVNQNEMFTAFDITKTLRQNGTQATHRNIKQIVHALYNHGDMQGYDRSLVDVNGAPVRPFLYHPMSADSSTYRV